MLPLSASPLPLGRHPIINNPGITKSQYIPSCRSPPPCVLLYLLLPPSSPLRILASLQAYLEPLDDMTYRDNAVTTGHIYNIPRALRQTQEARKTDIQYHAPTDKHTPPGRPGSFSQSELTFQKR